MEQINLNLIPNGVNPVAHCKQYDVGRTFRCNLFEGNAVYTLDGTETVECEVHKPDGNLVTLALTNTGSTYVDVTTTLQMCACSGESLAAIKITSGGVELGSLNFVLYCERSPLEGGITSDSGIYNLETQVASLVATEVANQYDSANVVFDSEPTAGHGNGYAVTSEGVKTELDSKADTSEVGDLTTLTTTAQSSVVDAVNEVDGDVGDLSNLTTTATSDLVSAINEVDGDVGDLSNLTTTATSDLVSAVDEVDGDIGDLSNLTTTAQSDVVSAINELDGDIGDLSQLTTSVQSSLVGAVNEVVGDTYTKSEVDTKLGEKAPIDFFNRYDLSSGSPIVISNVGAYHCFLIVGFVQGIGVLTVVVKIVNGTVSTVDFITGASFSSGNIAFSYTSGTKKLTITTPQAGSSYLAIMRTGST